MALFVIAGLTLKEAVRRKTLLGSLLLGLLVLALSWIVTLIRFRFDQLLVRGVITPEEYQIRYSYAQSAVILLCISAIKILSSLFALLLAGGSISSEIERGLLAIILPKPISRGSILVGKWLGMNLVLTGSVFLWTALLWASLTLQTRQNMTPLFPIGALLALFPLLVSTLALSLSVFAQRLLGTSLTLAIIVVGWFDGILNSLSALFDVSALYNAARICSLIFPQSVLSWKIEYRAYAFLPPPPRRVQFGVSPEYLENLGMHYLHTSHLGEIYVFGYLVLSFLLGAILFHRRDV